MGKLKTYVIIWKLLESLKSWTLWEEYQLMFTSFKHKIIYTHYLGGKRLVLMQKSPSEVIFMPAAKLLCSKNI